MFTRCLGLLVVLGCSAAQPRPSAAPAPVVPAAAAPSQSAPRDPSSDAEAATRAFDRVDFETAKTHAANVLAANPTDPGMLTLVTIIACIEGDSAAARESYAKLTGADRDPAKARCERYGVEL